MAQLNLEERFKGWKERLKINIYDLHNDVASQPSYYADVAEVAAELKFDIQLAKGNLDLVKAEVSSEFVPIPTSMVWKRRLRGPS